MKNLRHACLAAGVLIASTATLMGGGAASAAQIGTLTVSPATSSTADVFAQISTSGFCPAGTANVIVRLFGAGMPAEGYNLTGSTNISAVGTTPTGHQLTTGETFRDAFQAQGVVSPAGQYDLQFLCLDAAGIESSGEFVGLINFNAPAGTFNSGYTTSVPSSPTTTTVSVSDNSIAFGDSVDLTATIAPAAAAGTVQFKDNGNNLGAPVAVSGGTAVLTTSALGGGTHNITADFLSANTGQYGNSSDNTAETITVAATATSTAITGAGTSAQYSAATFTANVTPAAAAGTVQFKVDGVNAGAPVTVSGGTAEYSTTSLSVGTHTVDATFTPAGGNYSPSSAPQVTHEVTGFAGVSLAQDVVVTVPTGALTMVLDDVSNVGVDVDLGTAVMDPDGAKLTAAGSMHEVRITDTRDGDPGWQVQGIVTDFFDDEAVPNAVINGFNLGWTPYVGSLSANQSAAFVLGNPVAAGEEPTPASVPGPAIGLEASRTLGTAPDDSGNGTAVLGADLALNIPTDVPAGTYGAVLTLTAS